MEEMNVTLRQQELSPAGLASVARAVAASPARWRPLVQFRAGRRWYLRVADARYEMTASGLVPAGTEAAGDAW
jgi:hypothetical protein